MSSNHQHININRSNYEEYFLLYLDGELKEGEMQLVEEFVARHPQLQEEFDLLLTTKLDAEELAFEQKDQLLSHHMKAATIDESLLLFIDDELGATEKKQVEKKIGEDSDYRDHYQLLARVKLDATEILSYPNKKELYRHTDKRIVPMLWYRIAVVLILALGLTIIWQSNIGDQSLPEVAVKTVETQKRPIRNGNKIESPVQQDLVAQDEQNIIAYRQESKQSTSIAKKLADKKQAKKIVTNEAPDLRDRTIAYNEQIIDGRTKNEKVELPESSQQTINNHRVTSTTQPTYTNIDAAATTESMVSNAVALNNEEKKGSVRGFLRKASRFIERRTGINPLNEDDELVIAAVALKL